ITSSLSEKHWDIKRDKDEYLYVHSYGNINSYKYVNIEFSTHITRYASPSDFPFLFEQYDMTIHVDTDLQSYHEYIRQWDNRIELNTKELNLIKGLKEVDEYSDLDIGDKNTLIYTKKVRLRFNKGYETTKKKAEEISKLVYN